MDNKDFTLTENCDTLDLSLSYEDETMPTKFYNFNCIILYAYIDKQVAWQLTNNAQLNQSIQHLINTPLDLYENISMARKFASNIQNKQLVAFAVYVESLVYDELDLFVEEKVKQSKKTKEQVLKEVHVIRKLNQYKENGSKSKLYISYIIQNQNAIKQVFPLK